MNFYCFMDWVISLDVGFGQARTERAEVCVSVRAAFSQAVSDSFQLQLALWQ
jgi:transcription-repair coupling factor (superfamily II helicase)